MDLPLEYVGPTSWFPDETIFSLASRFHRLSGHARAEDTSRLLFGLRQRGAIHDFTPGLAEFARRTHERFGTAETIALERTLLGLYLPFKSEALARYAIDRLACDSLGSLKYKLGLLTSRFGASHPLKACDDCMALDVQAHGVAYWHRTHQWPGVWFCPAHHTRLRTAGEKIASVHRFQFVLPDEATWLDGKAASPDALKQAPVVRAQGIALARAICEFETSNGPGAFSPESLSAVYRSALIERGLASTSGRLRLKPLGEQLCRFVAPLRYMPDLQALPASPEQTLVQFARVLRGRSETHPIRHILLMLWLFESMGTFMDAVVARSGCDGRLASESTIQPTEGHGTTEGCDPWQRVRALVELRGWSVTRAAAEVGLDKQPVLEWLQRHGIAVSKRPKKLDSKMRQRVIDALEKGRSNDEIARGEGLSRVTVGRVMRSVPGLRERCSFVRERMLRD
ncbi:TnsD family Tn7-like transposition protein, partial [Salinisphaera hydrothermalis]|uniref:TnsD family Tn7-like transposition protein n=1 Tax=Salinisphaera hydrothermalis TaxID=563188 RepID=UPI003341CF92